jgi:hypothetical protein
MREDYLLSYLNSSQETKEFIASLMAFISSGKLESIKFSENLSRKPYVPYYLYNLFKERPDFLHHIERKLLSPPELETLVYQLRGISKEELEEAAEWERGVRRKMKEKLVLLFSLPPLLLLGLTPLALGLAIGAAAYSILPPLTKKARKAKKASESVNKKLLSGIEENVIRDIKKYVNANASLATVAMSSPFLLFFLSFPSPAREIAIALTAIRSTADALYYNSTRIRQGIKNFGRRLAKKLERLPYFASVYSLFDKLYQKIKPRVGSFLKWLDRNYERHLTKIIDKISTLLYLIGLASIYNIPYALLIYLITPYVSNVRWSRDIFTMLTKPIFSSLYKYWPNVPEVVKKAVVYLSTVKTVGGVNPFDEKEMRKTAIEVAKSLYEVTALKDAAREVIEGLERGTIVITDLGKGFVPPFYKEGNSRLGYCISVKVLEGESVEKNLGWKIADQKLLQYVAELYRVDPTQILQDPSKYLFIDFVREGERIVPIACMIEIGVRNYKDEDLMKFVLAEEVYHAIQIAEVTRHFRERFRRTISTIPMNPTISSQIYTPYG